MCQESNYFFFLLVWDDWKHVFTANIINWLDNDNLYTLILIKNQAYSNFFTMGVKGFGWVWKA